MIGYGRQTIDPEDIKALVEALESDYLTQGPAVDNFERAIADYVGAKYAVAVSSATTGLHIACLAAGLGVGDIGVTQPITFVASANAMRYCNAKPYLVDVDPTNLNMSKSELKKFLGTHPECKVVMPVSYAGLSALDAEFREIAGKRIIIEDSSHSLGAVGSDGKKVGSSEFADMTVFSFHPVKPITTGEGGVIVTNNENLYKKLMLLRSHGIVREEDQLQGPMEARGPWYYEQQSQGFNYRLSDLQCALGLSQLSRIDDFMAARRTIARKYDQAFKGLWFAKPIHANENARSRSGHHLYVLRFDFDAMNMTRTEVIEKLREQGIGTQVHYVPVYKHPYHQTAEIGSEQLYPESESYYKECLTIPIFPRLSSDQQGLIIKAILELVE